MPVVFMRMGGALGMIGSILHTLNSGGFYRLVAVGQFLD